MANNFAEAMQQGYAFGSQQRQEREQRNRLAELEGLSSKVISGDLDATSRVYALDPNQAKTLQGEGDRQRRQMIGAAKYMKGAIDSGRPGAAEGAWSRTVRPFLIRAGYATEDQLSPNWQNEYGDTLDQVLATEGAGLGGGSGVQSTYVDEGGNRVAIMRDGSTQVLGRNDAGANQQTLTIDVNGVPTQVTFDRRTGRYTNAALGGQPPAAQPPSGMQVVGGQQVFIDPSLPDTVRSGLLQSLQSGQEPQSMAVAAPTGTPLVGRRKEDEARAVAQAQSDVELSNLPTKLDMQTQADIAKSRGVEQAKSEQERASNERAKTAQLNNVDRGLTRIDAALKALSGRLVDTGPIDGRLMVSTPQGQELEAAVGAIQNDMLALTRVPGIGSQSDLEAKIANLKYPSIYNHPSVNAANVQQLKAFMGDLRNQITGSAAQGGRTVVRTGTSNGRKVIQYSDGSVEYGN